MATSLKRPVSVPILCISTDVWHKSTNFSLVTLAQRAGGDHVKHRHDKFPSQPRERESVKTEQTWQVRYVMRFVQLLALCMFVHREFVCRPCTHTTEQLLLPMSPSNRMPERANRVRPPSPAL